MSESGSNNKHVSESIKHWSVPRAMGVFILINVVGAMHRIINATIK